MLNSTVFSDPLTGSEEATVAKTINSMIEYASSTDCLSRGGVAKILKRNTLSYLDSLAESFLARTVPGESPSIQINNEYNIYL